MLKDKENDGVNHQNPESKHTLLKSDENKSNPDDKIMFLSKSNDLNESKPSKLGISQELTLSYLCDNKNLGQSSCDKVKGKLVVNDIDNDEDRFVERDFLQLSENSLKRVVENDEIYGMSRDKKPKLETLDLSLALPDTSMSLAASNGVEGGGGDPSVSLRGGRSVQSLGRSNSGNTLKKLISVPERRDELVRLQLRLERRSDLTSETLSKSNQNQLILLVSIRMGLESFLSAQHRLPTNELIEIFLYERCKNVSCKRLLPVEDCDCKICSTKKGFCSECMCPVCLNFDCASNLQLGWV